MELNSNSRGILAMCMAMALFVVNDAFVKLATTSWPVHQIMVVRGLFATLIAFTMVVAQGQTAKMPLLARPSVLLRCVTEGFVALTFISALASLPIADVTAILLLSPLLITVAGALFLGEDVRWRRWVAVMVGFAGMLLVVQPQGGSAGMATVLAFLSTLGVAARDIFTRRLSSDIPSSIVAVGTTIATTLTGVALSLFLPWAGFDWTTMLYILGAAITVATGNYAIIIAFRDVEVSVVSPFRYTVILWAVIAGYLVFGDVPGAVALLGIALIVCSGIYTLYREQVTKMRSDKPG
ncbi:MAG: DMT family transporter [Beijerinckiaceae bacterium]